MKSIRWTNVITLGITYITLALLGILVALPFFWMISTSLKQPDDVFVYPPQWIPDPVVWSNYPRALTRVPFLVFLKNTLVVTISALFGTVLSSSLAAFSFARLRWPGRDVLFFVVLTTLMIPYQVTLVPRFIIFRKLGWLDSLLPLIVPWYLGGGPFNIFLLRQFFMTVPPELDDAARIDGCGFLAIYARILLPLAKPSLAAVAIFSVQARWNEFLLPLIFINRRENFTLALGLRLFQEQYYVDWTGLMAASTVVMLPILVIFYFAQRYFIQGVVFTGVKA